MITVLVLTTCQEFAQNAYVDLDDSKVLHVELEFYEPYLRCLKCFSADHNVDTCSYVHKPRITPTGLLAQLHTLEEINRPNQ